MPDKLEEALALSEEILSGLETETLRISSAALRCLRLARLMNHIDAVEWFTYETTGYSIGDAAKSSRAFAVAQLHGRSSTPNEQGADSVIPMLPDELETAIQVTKSLIDNLTKKQQQPSFQLITKNYESLKTCQKLLSILRAEYYNYALSVNLEVKFSRQAEEVFSTYRQDVDKRIISLAPEAVRKFEAAYQRLSSDNPESWSQALTSCRRVIQEIADNLFPRTFPDFSDKVYVTKSGKNLDVSGANYMNRLFAIVDHIAQSKTSRKLIGSNILYVIDWMESLHNQVNKGVHELDERITYQEARASILHTYMLLGDVSILLAEILEK